MGCDISKAKPVSPKPPLEPKPSYDYIVRGNFIPQQNGDLKVHEEQGSTDVSDLCLVSSTDGLRRT